MKSINTANLIELQLWCREYETWTPYPADALRRFAIGFYQIYQGIEWQGSDSADESFAAAAIHLMIVGEKLKLGIEAYTYLNFSLIPWEKDPFRVLIHTLSKAQCHLIYSTNAKNVTRRSRYSEDILSSSLAYAVKDLFGLIEPIKRPLAIETATTIMTGRL